MDEICGWRADPFGVHQERFFDLNGDPTHVVRDDGHESYEPPESNDLILNHDKPSGAADVVTKATEPNPSALDTHTAMTPILVSQYRAPHCRESLPITQAEACTTSHPK
jgi:hypothetical protein